MEIKEIIINHVNNYPEMEATDYIKLLFQNEFGGGHLVTDKDKCLQYIKYEFDNTEKKENIPLYTEIGNGIIRVNLNSIHSYLIDIESLCEIFIKSSKEVKGSIDSFKSKINTINELIDLKKIPLNKDVFNLYLNEYSKNNYPMVSHSQKYRELYHPAYRIILRKYLKECLKENV